VFYGEVTNEKNRKLPDLTDREKVILVSVVVVILWMGIYPQPFLRRLDLNVAQVIQRVERGQPSFALQKAVPPAEPTR
jgi:NADH-quinone oxidoreductase subunit M